MISDLLLWSGISLLLYALYKWSANKNDYFEKRGVSSMKPKSIIAILSDLTFSQKSMVDLMTEQYIVNPGNK